MGTARIPEASTHFTNPERRCQCYVLALFGGMFPRCGVTLPACSIDFPYCAKLSVVGWVRIPIMGRSVHVEAPFALAHSSWTTRHKPVIISAIRRPRAQAICTRYGDPTCFAAEDTAAPCATACGNGR